MLAIFQAEGRKRIDVRTAPKNPSRRKAKAHSVGKDFSAMNPLGHHQKTLTAQFDLLKNLNAAGVQNEADRADRDQRDAAFAQQRRDLTSIGHPQAKPNVGGE